MLKTLTIDIGNSSVSCALFDGERAVRRFERPAAACRSAAALGRWLRAGVGARAAIEGIAIVSVVPRLDPLLKRACRAAFKVTPRFATCRTVPMRIAHYDRRQLGADRLVAAFAAWKRFCRPVVVVDAGTGITIDLVDGRGTFRGGAIAPGLAMAMAALTDRTAKLPAVRPSPVKRALARTTAEAINAGVVIGTAGLIDRMVEELAEEAGLSPLVIATGGDAVLLSSESRTIRKIMPGLIHEGLRMLMNGNTMRKR